ncbi:MAG: hypothetical protein K2W95_04335 [Candidatus Obscuribacterales bacterium]|nr:hypothetical protein [Candidatus Obscuribacterales bacterium]
MQVVTYAGRAKTQCICSVVTEVECCAESQWWHIESTFLVRSSPYSLQNISALPPAIVTGHYDYCRNFIWPLMHGVGEVAVYNETAHNCYRSLNLTVAAYFNWGPDLRAPLINDFQFALLPSYLTADMVFGSLYLWQLPWPETFPEDTVEHVREIARGMLSSMTIGFMVKAHLHNFQRFVAEFLPEYSPMTETSFRHKSGGRLVDLIVVHSENDQPVGDALVADGRFCVLSMEAQERMSGLRAESVEKWWRPYGSATGLTTCA